MSEPTTKTDDEINFDEAVNTVHRTSELDKFEFDPENRRVNPAHVDELKTEINKNNLLHAQPITVNDDYIVIDGQHRLTAARQLEVAIYYIVVEGLTMEDAITLNINTRNWTYRDYLQYWIDKGKEEYIYFREFMNTYGLSYSICTGLLGLGCATDGNKLTDIFNSGRFKPKYKEVAEEVAGKLLQMKEYGTFATDRSFVLAFDEVRTLEEYDHETFMKKLAMAPDRFTKCTTKESYLRMMEDVINYHNHGKRIRLY